ncbi:PTS glucose transporter subunit IIA [Paenibacillus sp. FSL P4-0176]|uniref:PTS sugar transporter subunit IIA n=1 Tax=Paenibacillus sp. FSL P4-0176 TaxID=2921631 RepID=UPI0030CBD1DA
MSHENSGVTSTEVKAEESNPRINSVTEAVTSNRPKVDFLEIASPMNGTVVSLEQVPDPAFSEKHMGEGIAIEPSEGKVYAPFDGVIAHVMNKSKHAVILEHETGVQMLVHIGINTVGLKGNGFTAHVNSGDRVTAGQLLIEFDMDVIQSAGLPLITPVLIPSGN